MRGWSNKRWRTRSGKESGGETFTRIGLRRLLTNVCCMPARCVTRTRFTTASSPPSLTPPCSGKPSNCSAAAIGAAGDLADPATGPGALLQGLVAMCVPCGASAMTPAHSRQGVRRYRYYTCTRAQKGGWHACPSVKPVLADEIERLVLERICGVAGCTTPCCAIRRRRRAWRDRTARADLESEQRRPGSRPDRLASRSTACTCRRNIRPGEAGQPDRGPSLPSCRSASACGRPGAQVREQMQAIRERMLDEDEAATALSLFDPLWATLTPAEQARVMALLVERVDYDGAKGKVTISFHPTGIRALADEVAGRAEERRA